ncbi:SDR family NAD(P)-dependent oxidoreductase [Acidisphaera sp. L21]|uniref:SDR family NAD(P)-dependent oxidoreductase n=1 Tax=Acidisphaera sp. L21 TaxID=1641851 RepID=UPI00131DCFA4|nr:SDR family NAD(P)-dependent oxidoreductase [Acidisphaera sp. L21]
MAVSVVTGATGGLGRWIGLGLARAGHTVILVGRSRPAGEAAMQWIAQQVPTARLELLIADLSLIAATRQAAMLIDARFPEIDLLVNNVGTFCTTREVTEEGHERVLATNHLSAFVMTRALVPALRAAAKTAGSARIVNIGSSASDRAGIEPDDLEGKRRWGMVRSYSQSKLAMMMTSFGWAARLEGTGVVSNVVHPGAVATKLVRASGAVGLAWRAMSPFLLSEEQGADSPLHACLAPEFATLNGVYVKHRRPVRANRRTENKTLTDRVWNATETLAGG